MSIINPSANYAWINTLDLIRQHGTSIGPRGLETIEEMNQSFRFDMNIPFVDIPERKLNDRFRFAEAYWITCGSPLVEEASATRSPFTSN